MICTVMQALAGEENRGGHDLYCDASFSWRRGVRGAWLNCDASFSWRRGVRGAWLYCDARFCWRRDARGGGGGMICTVMQALAGEEKCWGNDLYCDESFSWRREPRGAWFVQWCKRKLEKRGEGVKICTVTKAHVVSLVLWVCKGRCVFGDTQLNGLG